MPGIVKLKGKFAAPAVDKVKCKKCQNEHRLTVTDCCLINDYECVNSLAAQIEEYVKQNLYKPELGLGI